MDYPNTVEPTLLLRAGGSIIKKQYENSEIIFGCAANWIHYSFMNNDMEIGDLSECAFAYLDKNSDSLLSLERQYSDLTKIKYNQRYYLSRTRNLFRPILCLYSISLEEIRRPYTTKKDVEIKLRLSEYCNKLKMSISDTYFLIIKSPLDFFNDLRNSLVDYKNYKNIKTIAHIDNENQLIFPKNIQYENEKEGLFSDYHNDGVVFLKPKKYEYQSELRFVLGNFIFNTMPIKNWQPTCLYNPNYLTLSLPNLHKYAILRKASDTSTIEIKSKANESNATLIIK